MNLKLKFNCYERSYDHTKSEVESGENLNFISKFSMQPNINLIVFKTLPNGF